MFDFSSSTSPVVQAVLFILVGGSIATWTIILVKSIQVWLIRRQNVIFRAAFCGAKNLQ